jgi:AcrR family transcriptional regulator
VATERAGSKREAAKAARKERIYETSLALFRSQGYRATTVEQIMKRTGLAKGTFFNYFPTKDAVLRYMGAREIGRLGAASLAGSDSSAVGKLKHLMCALAASFEENRDLVCLVFRSGISVPELMVGEAGGFSLRPTASLLLRQAQRAGEVNPVLNADMLASALDALYLQQLVRWCESAEPYPLSECLTGMADLLLLGISTQMREEAAG